MKITIANDNDDFTGIMTKFGTLRSDIVDAIQQCAHQFSNMPEGNRLERVVQETDVSILIEGSD